MVRGRHWCILRRTRANAPLWGPPFYDAGRLIVCTEAMRKPKPREVRAVIARAGADRERYFAAKRRSELVIIEEGQ